MHAGQFIRNTHTSCSCNVPVRHAGRGKARAPLARPLQRGEPPVRPERGAAEDEVAVEQVDGNPVLDLHVLDPGHLMNEYAHENVTRATTPYHITRTCSVNAHEWQWQLQSKNAL